jgi:mRNA-degrading endonuclease RelE of RelBE toxin-antitoxin system
MPREVESQPERTISRWSLQRRDSGLSIRPSLGAQANNVKPLKGGQGKMRLRVGDWRVIYTESLIILTVLKVGPRGAAYD